MHSAGSCRARGAVGWAAGRRTLHSSPHVASADPSLHLQNVPPPQPNRRRVHLPTHMLVAAVLLARQNRPVCDALLADGGSAASDAVLAWAGRLETAAGWLPHTRALAATQCAAALGPPATAACLQLLAWAQLLVGLFLGSWLVWLLERRSRRAFLTQVGCASVFVQPRRCLVEGWAAWAGNSAQHCCSRLQLHGSSCASSS